MYIYTLDTVLGQDIVERLTDRSRFRGVEIIWPGRGKKKITVDDNAQLAHDSLTGRLIIMDMRSQTQPMLQAVFNKVVCLNRADLNKYCYMILIGDGPVKLFQDGGNLDVFGPHLAKMRIDCNAAKYFFDPLLHYDYDEKPRFGIDRPNELLDMVPRRLEKAFEGKELKVGDIRPFFRAAKSKGSQKREKKKRRGKKLTKLFSKSFKKAMNGNSNEFSRCFEKVGYSIEGESLKLNVYPFYFEKLAGKMLKKARNA